MTQPLKNKIKNKPVNISKLARLIGLSPSYVHDLFAGRKKNPEAIKKVIDGINTFFK